MLLSALHITLWYGAYPTPIILSSILLCSIHGSLSSATVHGIVSKTETPPYPCQQHQWMVILVTSSHSKIWFRPFGIWTEARKLGTLVFYVTRKRNQQLEATSVQNTVCSKVSAVESIAARSHVNAEHGTQKNFFCWEHSSQKPLNVENSMQKNFYCWEHSSPMPCKYRTLYGGKFLLLRTQHQYLLSSQINWISIFSREGCSAHLFLRVFPAISTTLYVFLYVKSH